ncbi:PREDICTED: histone-lysine N-methyltransferase 2E-like [Priapulus caudatus]|uniref:Histone-lysine N-methyltransferase 2E-like n=1 Tax=Priapulus caudatus TaxID=37621 RepID=A0ABM1EBB6_PRICU|nr:PREDICTED: histone-lysine N-methyltransferase 2E-like [Priapulus caudatus]
MRALCASERGYVRPPRAPPNAEIEHIIESGALHICIYSTKPIASGKEVTIPFDYKFRECEYEVDCGCATPAACPVARFNRRFQPRPSAAAAAVTPAKVAASEDDDRKRAPATRRRRKSGKTVARRRLSEGADYEWRDWEGEAQGGGGGGSAKETRSRVKANRRSAALSPVLRKASEVVPEVSRICPRNSDSERAVPKMRSGRGNVITLSVRKGSIHTHAKV